MSHNDIKMKAKIWRLPNAITENNSNEKEEKIKKKGTNHTHDNKHHVTD